MKNRAAFFDCSSGISGDMCIGALLSAGASFEKFQKELAKIRLKGVRVSVSKVKRAGMEALKFDVRIEKKTATLSLPQMNKLIGASSLPEHIKKKGILIIKDIFTAEAKVHGTAPEKVHLHELGSPDTVIDVMGTLICLDLLGINEVYSSPLNLGGGFIKTEHGKLAVPAPATVRLLEGVPVHSTGIKYELVTPTGAALVRNLARNFGNMPLMRLEKSGSGAGTRDFEEVPNILRVFIGERQSAEGEITVLETNIDDMNPQIYDYVMEKLFKAGALDVFLTPIIMKKSRPAVKLSVLCENGKSAEMKKIIFGETTTIGIREFRVERTTLPRNIETRETELGKIRFKTYNFAGENYSNPEYDDLVQAARKSGMPLRKIMEKIKKTAPPSKGKKGK